MKEIETRLALLEEEETRLNTELIASAADYQRAREISAALEKTQTEIETLYAEYGELI